MAGRTAGVSNNVEDLHTNNQDTLHQLVSEVVKLTGFAEHKGLNVLCGWRIVCRKINRIAED